MRIKVEVKNDLIGDSIFWEGDSENIFEIKNSLARQLAQQVIIDGKTRRLGMWVVSEIKD